MEKLTNTASYVEAIIIGSLPYPGNYPMGLCYVRPAQPHVETPGDPDTAEWMAKFSDEHGEIKQNS